MKGGKRDNLYQKYYLLLPKGKKLWNKKKENSTSRLSLSNAKPLFSTMNKNVNS